MRFITHFLEPIAYFIYFCVLLFWSGKDKRGIIKILSGCYLVSTILIIQAIMVKSGTESTNIHFYTLLCMLTSFCMGAYFYNVLNRPWQKVTAAITFIINCVYYILNNILKPTLGVFDSLGYVLLSSCVVILIFMFMYQLLSEVKEEPLSLNFDFWFVSAQLFYFLGAFAIFLTFGYLTKRILINNRTISETLTLLWGFHNVLLFLSALITTGSIAWISYRSKSHSS